VRFAEAVFPVPPFVELTDPVKLVYAPAAAPVTVTAIVHGVPSATVAPVSAIPVGGVRVSVPPHADELPFVTVSPVGIVSVNATPVSATVFAAGFVIVKFSAVLPPIGIPAGLNALAITGGATTARFADAAAPVPPSFELIVPVVLLCCPAAVPVTLT